MNGAKAMNSTNTTKTNAKTKKAVAYLANGELRDIPKIDYATLAKNRAQRRATIRKLTKRELLQRLKHPRDAYCSAVVHKAKENIDVPISIWSHNVATTIGIDQLHINGYTSLSRSGSGANYIAVTEDTTQTINSSQSSLTGEISTNGATRVQASTHNHSASSSTSTIATTFTISGTGFSAGIVRSALFDAGPTGGNMFHIAAFSNGTSGVLASGDTLTVTWTITLS